MVVKKIGLAWISVKDNEKAKKFFTQDLGFKISCDVPEHNWMELQAEDGNFLFGVGQDDDQNPIKPGQNAVLALTVEDIDAAKAELEGKGIKVGDVVEIPGHVKMALFQDPDGNNFHLVQKLD